MQATARVQVVIEVELDQPWSGSEKVDEIYKRAEREAVESVQVKLLAGKRGYKIIGVPSVKAIITER